MADNKSYEEKKEDIKKALLKKCTDAGCGKKTLRFLLNNGRQNLMMKPKCTIYVDGYAFNLRYSKRSDTPFEDDQNMADAELDMYTVNVDDGALVVLPHERCLAAFLYLHAGHGENGFFRLEDKDKEAVRNVSELEIQSAVFDKIKNGQIEDLQSAYGALTGADPAGMEYKTLQSDLFIQARQDAAVVLDAFNKRRKVNK